MPLPEQVKLMTMREAAAMLGISLRKMYDLAAPAGPIPCYRLAPRITRFAREDLQAYIDAHRIKPLDPVKEAGPAKARTVTVKLSEPEESLLALFKRHKITPPAKLDTSRKAGELDESFIKAGLRPRTPRKRK